MSDVLDFPPNPVVGQTFSSSDGTTWVWTGKHWHPAGGGGGGGPGGGIPEPPTTGPIYGRGGAIPAWQPVLPLAGNAAMAGPLNMGSNLIRSLATPLLDTDAATKLYVDQNSGGGPGPGPGDGIPEAPSDGQFYGRSGQLGGQWDPVLRLSGGTLSGPLTGFAGNAQNPAIMTGPGVGLYPLSGTLGISVQGSSTFIFSNTGNVSQVSLNMFNNQINNLGAPTLNNHAVSLGYLLNTYRPNYTQLPPAVQQVPMTFLAARLPASGVVSVPIGMAVTVPPLAGNVFFYADVAAAADRTFQLRKISDGIENPLGTFVITAGSKTNVVGNGDGGSLARGDALQIVGPAVQDPTLANFGVTIMTLRT